MKQIAKRCCVVGGGPAGMMTGLLLARAGIDVLVIEKHADFLRDFRGDTVHPSTLELMYELGLLDEFLKRPHTKVRELGGVIGGEFIKFADFSSLPTKCKFIALMPQWEFLDFLASHAKKFPTFSLMMTTEATGLIVSESGVIEGVKAKHDNEDLHIMSDLVIAADGRTSIIRDAAGFKVDDFGAPMDVLWMRLPRQADDPPQTLGRIVGGTILVMLNRGDYWQCGYILPKGNFEKLKDEGLEEFRKKVAAVAPFTQNRVDELKSWDDIKLLTVRVDRLERWYRDGLLCIGDAAHAMSPVGGVGINLAIQDAVATANILWSPLSKGRCTTDDLAKVQTRRLYPTRMTQRLQVAIHNNILERALAAKQINHAPPALRLFNIFPLLRGVPAHVVGLGFRPEHIHTPKRI
jgi:2-polyprenyl-6-methoxyphenol hydroxylase-like FAD-dependent oxidoreductase